MAFERIEASLEVIANTGKRTAEALEAVVSIWSKLGTGLADVAAQEVPVKPEAVPTIEYGKRKQKNASLSPAETPPIRFEAEIAGIVARMESERERKTAVEMIPERQAPTSLSGTASSGLLDTWGSPGKPIVFPTIPKASASVAVATDQESVASGTIAITGPAQAKTYTFEEVLERAKMVASSKGRDHVKAILKTFGANSVKELKFSDYDKFMEALAK